MSNCSVFVIPNSVRWTGSAIRSLTLTAEFWPVTVPTKRKTYIKLDVYPSRKEIHFVLLSNYTQLNAMQLEHMNDKQI